ncbi:transmembrane sensor [Catalinimonas alkaloidigena]|uniref:FecR family protein n=1 Tax=Catalinimonas alkaloidigena TaxID=1075417 RepID=UPI0024074FAD|nr:FecR domain-containing protein [Catalinimonas alkaloidigena]MDF9798801.1 transmembrane sensor [Catalinimonas alkaloidigena]
MQDYTSYTAQEFALDKYFQQWVVAQDEDARYFWESWLAKHPEKQTAVMEAKAFIQAMPFEQYSLSPEEERGIWVHINSRISVAEEAPTASRSWYLHRLYRYAAFLLFPLMAGLLYFVSLSAHETLSTSYGEKRMISLPDGSLVTLNANSTLKFHNNWESQSVREVWLRGEAFFEVQKVNHPQQAKPDTRVKFVVHTPQVEVEVLGTEFNVKQRRQSTEVVLNSGKILLKREQKTIALLPGELARVSDTSAFLSKELVNVEVYDAWKSNQFVFDNSSLQEVAQMLRDTYGYEVEISPDVQDRKISSTAPVFTKYIPAFLDMLEKLYGVSIIQGQNVILIEKDAAP